MFANSHSHMMIAADRQRDYLAAAEQHRRAAEFRTTKRSSRQVTRVGLGWRRALRTLAIGGPVFPA
jgi:hypothetical protein